MSAVSAVSEPHAVRAETLRRLRASAADALSKSPLVAGNPGLAARRITDRKDQSKAAARSLSERRLLGVIEWLSGNESRALDDSGLIHGLGARLSALSIPVSAIALYLRHLHPELRARIVVWSPGAPVEIYDRAHTMQHIAAFAGSPVRRVMETREPQTVRADRDGADIDRLEIFRNRGIAELFIAPLASGSDLTSAVAFGTRRERGFTIAGRRALERILPALCGACELRLLRQAGATLLDTYVGPSTGRLILAGQIRRGDVESLEAALMLCDLRDFTGQSNRLPAAEMLERLNLYFDQVVPAIAKCGGEVLKFSGDAVLAFFRCKEGPAASCAAAFAAAREIHARLAAASDGTDPLSASIALHHGIVDYGNIGSGARLDFTVIGPDVNLVSRIQGVGSATGHPLLMSPRFCAVLGEAGCRSTGRHALKGFPDPVELFAPAPE